MMKRFPLVRALNFEHIRLFLFSRRFVDRSLGKTGDAFGILAMFYFSESSIQSGQQT